MNRLVKITAFLLSTALLSGCSEKVVNEEWRTFTGTNAGMRHVACGDITPTNVHNLTLAWEYDTGDSIEKGSTIPTTPLMIAETRYGVSQSTLFCAGCGAGVGAPAMYTSNGKQYLVIAAGGGKLGMRSGNKYIAFSFP